MTDNQLVPASWPLPFIPEGKQIFVVGEDHPHMMAAKQAAQSQSLDQAHPTGAVIVKGDRVLGRGANGTDYHEKYGCERKRLNIPTGERYDLCEGCSPKHHAEQKSIADVRAQGHDPAGADIYLWGHYWCCQSCWGVMMEAGINNVFLVEGADKKFGKK